MSCPPPGSQQSSPRSQPIQEGGPSSTRPSIFSRCSGDWVWDSWDWLSTNRGISEESSPPRRDWRLRKVITTGEENLILRFRGTRSRNSTELNFSVILNILRQ